MKLSAAQERALRIAEERGRLYRWPGGFWQARPAPEGWRYDAGRNDELGPNVAPNTIRALEARGLLTMDPFDDGPAYARRRVVTIEGLKILSDLPIE